MSMHATVPEAYVGLWRRTLLRAPSVEDTTTRVYWLQTPSWHADIRVPVDRPQRSDRAGLGALSLEEMLALARQQGFAGITEVEGELCRWHRRYDYQPPSGFNDVGRMQFEGPDRLLEHGVEQDYFEVWERIPGGGESLVLEHNDSEGRPALQLSLGPWVMFVRARRTALSRTEGLSGMLAAADYAERVALLDFEISFGRQDESGKAWRIELSTLPWLEGTDRDHSPSRQ
jgi:hypothetical protein